MLQTIAKPIESEHIAFSTFVSVRLPALRGEHIFGKRTQKQKKHQHLVISRNLDEFRACTKFSNREYNRNVISVLNDAIQRLPV